MNFSQGSFLIFFILRQAMTTTEFKELFQKNLDELIWRNMGWGPVPIHGKGEKGFSIKDRLRYNQKQIASGKLSKEEVSKRQAIIMKLSKETEKSDIKNAYKMVRDEFATEKTVDLLKGTKVASSSIVSKSVYNQYADRHEKSVKARLIAGKTVPDEVLEDYKNYPWFKELAKKK